MNRKDEQAWLDEQWKREYREFLDSDEEQDDHERRMAERIQAVHTGGDDAEDE